MMPKMEAGLPRIPNAMGNWLSYLHAHRRNAGTRQCCQQPRHNIIVVLSFAGAVASKPFADVDINSLSCDPSGQIFLLLPHFTDCSKFYTCANGKEVEMSCADGTIFDFELQTCNWPWATECVLRTEQSSNEEFEGSGSGSGSGYGEYEWSESENDVEPLGLLADLSAPMAPSHFSTLLDCSRADSAGRQVVHKGDCQRYWRCVAGMLQSVYCSDGLFFNEQTQQCDFEANVKCLIEQEDELQGEFIIHKK